MDHTDGVNVSVIPVTQVVHKLSVFKGTEFKVARTELGPETPSLSHEPNLAETKGCTVDKGLELQLPFPIFYDTS